MSFLKKSGKALADVIPGLGRFTFDSDTGTVFITSGTGVIGYRVAMSLLQAGHKSVRVGIWKGEREWTGSMHGKKEHEEPHYAIQIAEALEKAGAEVVDFDWSDSSCYEQVLRGVKTVFCSLPHMDHWADVFPTFLRVCKERRVEHFIKISFLRHNEAGERYRDNVPFVRFHGTCDDLLQQAPGTSRISYTILCTSHLMSTPLLHQGKILSEDHKFVTASYGMGVNYVSPNDVADAAVVVLLDQSKHRNKVYNLTGPGPTLDSDIAKLLSKAYGTEVQHIEMGYHDYAKSIKGRGLPAWLVRDSAAFEKMKASGVDELASSYTKDLEMIIGKKPETFAEYLVNKKAQRPGRTFP